MAETLFENETDNVDGEVQTFSIKERGGFVNRTLHIKGNLDGGTFTLLLWDGAEYLEVVDSAITAVPDSVNFTFRADKAKGRLTGCGASCDITAIFI